MTIETSTLRPGFLVSLKSSLRGNVSYRTRDLEADAPIAEGERRAKWETERVISDAAEHELGVKMRTKARVAITGVCAASAFGLLCPESSAEDLDKAIKTARAVAEEFNQGAKLSRLSIYVMVGRIAADDVEAVKAINSEIRELMEAMQKGIENSDVRMIREAASKAKSIGSMLSADAGARVTIAIEAGRKAARKIAETGEQASQEIDRVTIRKIAEMRTAFLDLDDAKEAAKPNEQGRALDLTPSDQPKPRRGKAAARALELED